MPGAEDAHPSATYTPAAGGAGAEDPRGKASAAPKMDSIFGDTSKLFCLEGISLFGPEGTGGAAGGAGVGAGRFGGGGAAAAASAPAPSVEEARFEVDLKEAIAASLGESEDGSTFGMGAVRAPSPTETPAAAASSAGRRKTSPAGGSGGGAAAASAPTKMDSIFGDTSTLFGFEDISLFGPKDVPSFGSGKAMGGAGGAAAAAAGVASVPAHSEVEEALFEADLKEAMKASLREEARNSGGGAGGRTVGAGGVSSRTRGGGGGGAAAAAAGGEEPPSSSSSDDESGGAAATAVRLARKARSAAYSSEGGGGGAAAAASTSESAYSRSGSPKLFGAGLDKHPLQGWTAEQVVSHANKLGLKTPKDQLILWSGLGRGDEGKTLSQEYAKINGGVTLEMTPGGEWLDKMDLFEETSPFSPQEATKIWARVSGLLASLASGQVRSLIGSVHPKSFYMSEELTELKSNPAILGVEELYLKPRFQFGKH